LSNSDDHARKNLQIGEIMKQITDIESFAARHLPEPVKRETKNWLYDCPNCGDSGRKKLSFLPGVTPKGVVGPWKCNICGEKGNLYSLLLFLGVVREKGEAAKLLKEAAGIVEDTTPSATSNASLKPGRPKGKGRGGKGGSGSGSDDRRRDPLPIAPPSSARIYSRFVELTHLTPEHRKEMKEKRGFSDATIDTLKFRSGGEYVAGVLTQLQSEFSGDELAISGVMIRQNNTLIPCEQLLQDRAIIPYMDEQGGDADSGSVIYHLRPHKLGFKDVAPQPYAKFFLKGHPKTIVFTEGEFKAVALSAEWKIPSLAVPGVASFAGIYFERLVGVLREAEIEKVVIIYDNEEKGDSSLPNYKEKVEDRFDTPFYAYLMGYKLAKEGFQTVIGNLPDAWREKGKIDFDMALAQGRTREDINKVIQAAVPPREYLDTLPEEGRPIIQRKIARFFKRFAVRREYNKYLATRHKGKDGEKFEEVISNFVINIKNNFHTGEGVIRNIELINEFGEVSKPFALEPEHMSGADAFKKFCFGKGNYIFKGSSADLTNIWEYEFSRDAGTAIHIPEKIGRIDDDKMTVWLFGNMAIKDGKVYRPGEDGIIWINETGYKPQSLHLSHKDEPIEDAIPSLYEGPVDIQGVAEKLRHCVGGYEAYIGIGWVVMTIFSKDIFAKYKVLPFLFPHGKRESGKSSFLRWIVRFFGIESDGISLPETSQNYIMRALGYFSSLGVWFDEYRNEPQVTKKDGFLRSAYNRQMSGKGIKQTFGAISNPVLGTISITGEEVPKDSGLFTRSCFIQMSSNKRNRDYYDELNVDCEKFSGFVFHLIINYEQYRKEILKSIAATKKMLIGLKISDRTAENWAIMAGCFNATVRRSDSFVQWIVKTCQDLKMSGENDHALNQFWDDINYLVSSNEIVTKSFIEYRPAEKILTIWFKGLHDAWSIFYRKKTGKEPFDWKSVSGYLRDEPYFLEAKNAWMNSTTKHCFLINIDKSPDNVKEIASVLETVRVKGFNDEV